MIFRSNIQASWIGRGTFWKNIWIPNNFKFYKKFLAHDFLLNDFLTLKKKNENFKISSIYQYNYIYDFSVQKSYEKIYLKVNKFSVDFSKLGLMLYFLWVFTFSPTTKKNWAIKYLRSTGFESFIKLSYLPTYFFFFWNVLEWNAVRELIYFNNWTEFENLPINIKSIVSAFENFFLQKNTRFFNSEILNKFNFFNKNFDDKYIPQDIFEIKPILIDQDKFWLSSFFLQPYFLWWYPNLIFFYQNWVHKSWIFSKKTIINTITSGYSLWPIATANDLSLEFFYTSYMWFIFVLWKFCSFNYIKLPLKIGLTKEFLAQQRMIFQLKLEIWQIIVSSIKILWTYLKAYLRYFSYEGWVKIYQSKVVFWWIGFFKWLIKSSVWGFHFWLNSLFKYIRYTFIFKISNIQLFKKLAKFFLNHKKFHFWWFKFTAWLIKKARLLVRWVKKKWKLSLKDKLNIIFYYIQYFSNRKLKIKKILFIKINKLFQSTLLLSQTTSLNQLFNWWIFLPINFLLFLIIKSIKISPFKVWIFESWPFVTPLQKYKVLWVKFKDYFTSFYFFLWPKRFQLFWIFNFWMSQLRRILSKMNWLCLCIVPPNILLFFYSYIYTKWLEWWKIFSYFHFCFSYTTPWIFFWIFQDLITMLNFNSLVHWMITYWQNFFFYYLFVLQLLKKMYFFCSQWMQLALSWPVWMFFQKEGVEPTIFDFFSSSLKLLFPTFVHVFVQRFFDNKKSINIIDISEYLAKVGNPNFWWPFKKSIYLNWFSTFETNSFSPFFIPFLSIQSINIFYFNRNKIKYFNEKTCVLKKNPFFHSWIPMHLRISFFGGVIVSAALIGTFIKKKLESENYVFEVIWTLNWMLDRMEWVRGFMFLLKGWFTRKERADWIWLRKGFLKQTFLFWKIDYYHNPVTLWYGVASIWIWLLLEDTIDDWTALI